MGQRGPHKGRLPTSQPHLSLNALQLLRRRDSIGGLSGLTLLDKSVGHFSLDGSQSAFSLLQLLQDVDVGGLRTSRRHRLQEGQKFLDRVCYTTCCFHTLHSTFRVGQDKKPPAACG